MRFKQLAIFAALLLGMGSPVPAAEGIDFTALGLGKPAFPLDHRVLDVPDLDGTVHRLEDYRGKVTLVSFWATWCAPCRRELPTLAALARTLGDEKFAVLAVDATDEKDRIKAFLGDVDHEGLKVLVGKDQKLAAAWFLRGLPVTYVLDPSGEVVLGAIGERVWDSPEMVDALRSLAAGN